MRRRMFFYNKGYCAARSCLPRSCTTGTGSRTRERVVPAHRPHLPSAFLYACMDFCFCFLGLAVERIWSRSLANRFCFAFCCMSCVFVYCSCCYCYCGSDQICPLMSEGRLFSRSFSRAWLGYYGDGTRRLAKAPKMNTTQHCL